MTNPTADATMFLPHIILSFLYVNVRTRRALMISVAGAHIGAPASISANSPL